MQCMCWICVWYDVFYSFVFKLPKCKIFQPLKGCFNNEALGVVIMMHVAKKFDPLNTNAKVQPHKSQMKKIDPIPKKVKYQIDLTTFYHCFLLSKLVTPPWTNCINHLTPTNDTHCLLTCTYIYEVCYVALVLILKCGILLHYNMFSVNHTSVFSIVIFCGLFKNLQDGY